MCVVLVQQPPSAWGLLRRSARAWSSRRGQTMLASCAHFASPCCACCRQCRRQLRTHQSSACGWRRWRSAPGAWLLSSVHALHKCSILLYQSAVRLLTVALKYQPAGFKHTQSLYPSFSFGEKVRNSPAAWACVALYCLILHSYCPILHTVAGLCARENALLLSHVVCKSHTVSVVCRLLNRPMPLHSTVLPIYDRLLINGAHAQAAPQRGDAVVCGRAAAHGPGGSGC